jgi:hypothetical protein
MNEIMWRKSAYSSSNGGNCVEVGQVTRTVAVRDTKQYGRGPMLRFTSAAWRRFTDQVKRSLGINRATERPRRDHLPQSTQEVPTRPMLTVCGFSRLTMIRSSAKTQHVRVFQIRTALLTMTS